MLLPCRIHRARNGVASLHLTLLFVASLLALQSGRTWAQATGSAFERVGVGWLPGIPIQITAGLDAGYDDNVTLSSNAEGSLRSEERRVGKEGRSRSSEDC